jgi:hypothetical protein
VTLFSDGNAEYFCIQHQWKRDGRWADSNLAGFLFEDLSYTEKRGEVGDRYRSLLAPQSASSDLWQKYGIHGFVNRTDAEAALDALNKKRLEHKFRIVKRTLTQRTEVMT